ncbi:hypothetical protein JXB41_00920 [Candidatus Woesearchaeota archaeon]|nr:hypothetical protein [Candidatus Woesearchaeota archaeon]
MKKRKNKSYNNEEDGMQVFWKSVSNSIKYMNHLLDSKTPENRLRVIIIILAAVTLGLRVLLFLHKDTEYNLVSVLIFGVFCGGFGLIFGKFYIKILDFFVKLSGRELESLQLVTSVLLISLPLSIVATVIQNDLLGNISLIVLVAQIPIIFFSGIKPLVNFTTLNPPKPKTEWNLWESLGRLNTILGIIGSIVTILTFILVYVLNIK